MRQSSSTPIVVQATIARDFDEFSADSAGAADGLTSFFEIRGLTSVTVQGFKTYCGAGYSEEFANSTKQCVKCNIGWYKDLPDNSACLQCGLHMTTADLGSTKLEV